MLAGSYFFWQLVSYSRLRELVELHAFEAEHFNNAGSVQRNNIHIINQIHHL